MLIWWTHVTVGKYILKQGNWNEWIYIVFHKAFQKTKPLTKFVHMCIHKQRHRHFTSTLMSEKRVRQRKKKIFTNCPDLTSTWTNEANCLGFNMKPKAKGTVDIGDSEVICHSTKNKEIFSFSWLIQLCILMISMLL